MEKGELSDFSHPQNSTNTNTPKGSPTMLGKPQDEMGKRKSMELFGFGFSKSDSKRVSSAPPFEVKRANSHGGTRQSPAEFAMTVTDTTNSVSVNTTTRTTKKSFLSVPKSPFRPGSPSLFKSRRQASFNEEDRDELPANPAKLDGFINYHLGELDRLRRELEYYTELLSQLSYTLGDISRREGMQVSTQRMQKRMQDIMNFRTSLGKIVGYHRFELERVAELKKLLGEVNHVKVKIPDAMINQPNDFEWRELFD